MMHPETAPALRYIPMGGDNSCGKSELAKQVSLVLQNPDNERTSPLKTEVVHVGDLYRFFSGLSGGFPIETQEEVKQSAAAALKHVQVAVDKETGELFLKPNGLDRFVQSAENGHASSRLGSNPHLTDFIHQFIFSLFDEFADENTLCIIEGRQDWGITGPAIRVHAPFTVRREFFRQERKEAAHWPIKKVTETIQARDGLDEVILAPLKARHDQIIDVYRTDYSLAATRAMAKEVGGILFDYRAGTIPSSFGTISLTDGL